MSGRKAREERREERQREEGEVASRERRRRLLQLASAVAFLAVAGVAVAIVVSQSQSGGGSGGGGAVKRELRGIPQNGMVLGNPEAKVTLVEFGDLQCPVCKAYSEEILPDLFESVVRSGSAKIEFRNFTIISEQSVPAGAAAVAAGKQGRAWNFIELFYRNQGQEASGYVTDSFLEGIAREAGVSDLARWNRERKQSSALAVVHRTTAEAESLGFSGTPSFAVEGPRTNGLKTLGTPRSAGAMEEAIEEAG